MEMAVLKKEEAIFKILTEHKEITDDVKLIQLSMLMEQTWTAIACEEPSENLKTAFQDILHSLSSVQMVKKIVIVPT